MAKIVDPAAQAVETAAAAQAQANSVTQTADAATQAAAATQAVTTPAAARVNTYPDTAHELVRGTVMPEGITRDGNKYFSADGKQLSPKHKVVRGIPNSFETTWVPFDQTPEDNDRLMKIAGTRKLTAPALGQLLITWGLEQYKDAFDKDVEAWDKANPGGTKSKTGQPTKPLDQMTAEELAAFEKKSQTALERAQTQAANAAKMLADAKARQQANAANAG